MSPFFARLAKRLRAEGHNAHRINLGFGDWLFWWAGGAHNCRGTFENWPNYIEGFLKENNVTDIILLGDCRPYHHVAIGKARQANVDVTVIELGYLRPNWLTIERGGMSSLSHFPNNPETILAIADEVEDVETPEPDHRSYFARMAMWDVIYKLSNVFFFWLYPSYKFHSINNPIHEYALWIVRLITEKSRGKKADQIVEELVENCETTPFYVYALQLNTDYQIRAHSPFVDQQQTIDVIFQSFKDNSDDGSKLVVKQHPLDAGMVNWKSVVRKKARNLGIEEQVIFIDGGNLDLLLKNSLGLVVVNSTVGTSAISFGVPFITLGAAIFDVEGLSFQGALDDFWVNRQKPDPVLSEAYLKTMKATIQVSGGFYSDISIAQGVDAASRMILANKVNDAGAYEERPPRYKKKASVEVSWF